MAGLPSSRASDAARVRVWDLPTRLCHWAILACVVGSFVTINLGGNWVAWHFRFGYALLALVVFRVLWGFAGSRWARFSSFPPSPRRALGYLRGRSPSTPGHNPLGALSVYALLAALAVQVGTGLFANDAIMWDGPLRSLVSGATSDWLTRVHKTNRFVLVGLIALHVAAIAYYALVRRERLTAAMVGGDKTDIDPSQGVEDGTALRLRALLVAAISVAAVWAMLRLAG